MECPACGNGLEQKALDDITVDVCSKGCGGVWFDRFELNKVDELHESAGEELLDMQRDSGVSVDHSARRQCPKCNNITMMRHFFSVKKEVEVDECPGCAGIWLDYGELGKIRSQFSTEEERSQAAEKYYSEIFGVELDKMKSESAEKAEKAKRVAMLFRFVCPSYYIPGEQDWGAF